MDSIGRVHVNIVLVEDPTEDQVSEYGQDMGANESGWTSGKVRTHTQLRPRAYLK